MKLSNLTTGPIMIPDRTAPLTVGQHIFCHDRISIDTGSSHGWGLYHDYHNDLYLVTNQGIVQASFSREDYMLASKMYYENK